MDVSRFHVSLRFMSSCSAIRSSADRPLKYLQKRGQEPATRSSHDGSACLSLPAPRVLGRRPLGGAATATPDGRPGAAVVAGRLLGGRGRASAPTGAQSAARWP